MDGKTNRGSETVSPPRSPGKGPRGTWAGQPPSLSWAEGKDEAATEPGGGHQGEQGGFPHQRHCHRNYLARDPRGPPVQKKPFLGVSKAAKGRVKMPKGTGAFETSV